MNEKNEIKKRYDEFAVRITQDSGRIKNLYTDVSSVTKYFRRRKVEAALQLGGFRKEGRILEVGANAGQNTVMFAQIGFQMVGIDISGKMVGLAKKNAEALNLKNIEYFCADAEDLSLFPDETFDGAVSFSTLRYVPNLRKSLKEIFRVIKKDAVAVLDFPNKYCPWFTLLKNKFGVENHMHDHFYSTKELVALFKEIGFRNIETKKILFTHYTFPQNFLEIYKLIDLVGENIPFIKESAAIILCKGGKA
jgi:ubiquinone/menaquinone biosynthesis C-methylase UbiE